MRRPNREEVLSSINSRAFLFKFALMKFPISSPKDGQTRTVRRFAWLPEEMTDIDGNRFTVFFEFYNVEQKYIEGQVYIHQEWIDVKKVVRK